MEWISSGMGVTMNGMEIEWNEHGNYLEKGVSRNGSKWYELEMG